VPRQARRSEPCDPQVVCERLVWTCDADSTVSGKPATYRYTITEASPSSYTYTVERFVEGGAWTQTMDLKATKAKSRRSRLSQAGVTFSPAPGIGRTTAAFP
jgi:hypothetical protein